MNDDQINLHFWLVFFAPDFVNPENRDAVAEAMPAFFASSGTKNPNPKLCNFI